MAAPPRASAPDEFLIRPHSVPGTTRRFALWRYPVIAIVVGIVAELLTRRIDRALQGDRIPEVLDRGSAEDVRAVLSVIASASITTLALVLSLTMVVLTMAATQFGPRLIRGFLGSRTTKLTIALFSGLFVYSLLVLDSITTGGSEAELIPDVGTSVSLVLTFAAVVSLIWYVHEVAQAIQMNQVVRAIADDLSAAIASTRADRDQAAAGRDPLEVEAEWATRSAAVQSAGTPVRLTRSGYLQQIDYGPLVRTAERHDAVVDLRYRAGDFVVAGDVIALVDAPHLDRELLAALEEHVDVGPHRTLDQDLEFAVDKMVEIALRALSPAINDTFTGLACLDWLAAALRTLSTIPVDRSIHCDDAGRIRVVERSRHFPGFVTSAYAKIRQSAAGNPAIGIRMLESIAKVAETVHTDDGRAALAEEADMVVATALASGYVAKDEAALRARYDRVRAVLDQPTSTATPGSTNSTST